MEVRAEKGNTCKDCTHFRLHGVVVRGRICFTQWGHCVSAKSKMKPSAEPACKNFDLRDIETEKAFQNQSFQKAILRIQKTLTEMLQILSIAD